MPRLLVLTDRRRCPHGLVPTMEAVVAAGATGMVVREKDLDVGERLLVAAHALTLLAPVGGTVLLASGPAPAPAPAEGVAGVHLAAGDPWPEDAPEPLLVGRSCHDADEVRRAVAEGVDHVTVSPVWATPSKPGYGPALGVDRLAELVEVAGATPVFALGGVGSAEDVAACLAAGAYGVAVMGAVMAADDPGAVTVELLSAIDHTAERNRRARTR